ncbi:MAG TPA: hypothetical protein VN851_08135 [Thermoanaerobaculia bacterium]|nr:hypothetical protein [Thermoanaerobaculia bacterium]
MTAPAPPGRLFAQGLGLFLFLFIPLVLFLFVRHPSPVGASLAVGLVLIVAHRAVARPWAARVREAKCLWCNRMLTGAAQAVDLELNAGAERLVARTCPEHRLPAAKFFSWLDRAKAPLRLGTFLPLLALLLALGAAAFGHGEKLPLATAIFQLVVGLTVNLGAWGYLGVRRQTERAPLSVPFPAHNFFLLGVRTLLWIFRGVGIWWIWVGARALIAG